MHRILTVCVFVLGAYGAEALELFLPDRSVELAYEEAYGVLHAPAWQDIPVQDIEGRVTYQSWKIEDASSFSPLLEILIGQYARLGYRLEYRCTALECGGYAFRAELRTSPPPDFQISPKNYSFAKLSKDSEMMLIFGSVLDGNTYWQISHVLSDKTALTINPVGSSEREPAEVVPTSASTGSAPLPEKPDRFVISGISFAQASTSLEIDFPKDLEKIAMRMQAAPNVVLYLVGHSDQLGELEPNKTISKARAEAVRTALIRDFKLDPTRVYAEGVGFLAPISDNATTEGQRQNRRVEAIFIERNR